MNIYIYFYITHHWCLLVILRLISNAHSLEDSYKKTPGKTDFRYWEQFICSFYLKGTLAEHKIPGSHYFPLTNVMAFSFGIKQCFQIAWWWSDFLSPLSHLVFVWIAKICLSSKPNNLTKLCLHVGCSELIF